MDSRSIVAVIDTRSPVQPGTIMRVSGEGMPHVGSPFDRGDLYFRISVIFPVLPLPRDALSIDRVPSHRRERGLATSSKLNQWDASLFRIPLERIKSRLSLHFSRPVSHRALSGPTKCTLPLEACWSPEVGYLPVASR